MRASLELLYSPVRSRDDFVSFACLVLFFVFFFVSDAVVVGVRMRVGLRGRLAELLRAFDGTSGTDNSQHDCRHWG